MLDHWPMIGRTDEFAEINRLLAIDGLRGVALLGKPGVGKSRLAREAVLEAARAGWTVRSIAATATSRSIPLGAFALWTDDAGGEPHALARRVVDALTAGARAGRLLVFVDDAHLLDDLSAMVVHQLAQSGAATVIVTIRHGESAPAAVTALWKDDMVRRVELEPLTRSDAEHLVKTALGAPLDPHCAQRLWQITRGNALFLRQLVGQEWRAGRMTVDHGVVRWHGDTAVSGTVADLVDAHIGTIGDEVGAVVDFVAVAEPIDWHSLWLLADRDAIEEAEQRELIRTAGDEVFVGHPIYAEVRLNRCGPSRLKRLRGQVATVMKNSRSAAQVMKRGVLWLDSDLPLEPGVLLAAATAASSLLDFEAAERLFRAVADTGVGAQARIPLAFSLFMRQETDLALEVLDGVEVDDATQSEFINDVVMRASNLLWGMRSPERSWRLIDDALESASGAHRQQLLVFRANQMAIAGRPTEVLDTLAAVRYDDLDQYGTTMGRSAECMSYGELGQPDLAVAKAVESGRSLDGGEQGGFLRQPLTEFHAFALTSSGRIGEAVDLAERHWRSQVHEPEAAQFVASEILGMAQLAAGDLTSALRHLPDFTRETDPQVGSNFHAGNSIHRFALLRVQALARSGDAEEAQRVLDDAAARRHPAYVFVTSTELLAEAWVAAARLRITEARRLARQAADFARAHDQRAREVWCLQTAVQFDDVDAAERLGELATLVEGPRADIATRYAVAIHDDHGDGLDSASVEFETMGDVLAAADSAAQAASSHRRAGRTGSSMTAATRAHRLAASCGGATSPAIAAAAFPPAFTNREREIAVLIARGSSNRDIAEAMSLSVRTVESHIYRACAKVGVAGRAGLGDVMRHMAG